MPKASIMPKTTTDEASLGCVCPYTCAWLTLFREWVHPTYSRSASLPCSPHTTLRGVCLSRCEGKDHAYAPFLHNASPNATIFGRALRLLCRAPRDEKGSDVGSGFLVYDFQIYSPPTLDPLFLRRIRYTIWASSLASRSGKCEVMERPSVPVALVFQQSGVNPHGR